MAKSTILEITSLTPDEVLERVDAVLRHQDNVREGCELLGRRLIKDGEIELGVDLIRNGREHDNSKLRGIEFIGLTQDKDSDLLKFAIAHHQQVNAHHPEYWHGIDNVPELFLAEMVCDWRARSIEFGSSLRDWIKNHALEKFKIPANGKTCKKIKEFVDLLLEDPFKPIK